MNAIVTIAVCTWNRADILEPLVAELARQCRNEVAASVLVVDNNSTDKTSEVISRHPVVGVFEPTQGLAHARNRALREATTPWVAFLDDECRVPDGWVTRLVEVLIGADWSVAGGPYDGVLPAERPSWAVQEMFSHDRPGGPRRLQANEYVSGGNFVVCVEEALASGGFDPSLGMVGTRVGHAEEVSLQLALRSRGGSVWWEPSLRVAHLVRTDKLSAIGLLRETYSRSRDWQRVHPSGRSRPRALASAAIGLVRLLGELGRSFVRSGVERRGLADQFVPRALPLVRQLGGAVGDLRWQRVRVGAAPSA